jgi:hypothetical protein
MAMYSVMRARVENWADWKKRQGDGAGRFASVNLTDPTPAPTDPYGPAPIHPNEEDAWAIDGAMKKVVTDSALRATVEAHYLSRYTEAEKLRRLCVAKSSFYARLDRVDGMLVRFFSERERMARNERERVEKLTRSMRPA